MSDVWKEVPGFERFYQVSKNGEVRSMLNNKRRVLTPVLNSDGYETVNLYLRGRAKRVRVNRIVCEAFNGPPTGDRVFAAHRNGQKRDNRASNLVWATRQDNADHKREHGTHYVQPPVSAMRRGDGHPHAKITVAQAISLKSRAANGEPVSALAREFGISRQHAYLIIAGKRRSDDSAGLKGIAQSPDLSSRDTNNVG